jgi:putative holliday junction resolvase
VTRAVGLDLGAKRIGVALSDNGGTVATPYEVITRHGDVGRDHAAIAAIVADTGAEIVVVGLPIGMSGQHTAATDAAAAEVAELARVLPVPVEIHDERLSTVSAARSLKEAGLSSRQQRSRIDQVAAAVILQSWLERRRST